MKIELASIERITPYYRMPRKTAAAVKDIAARIKRFGFRQPIIVDREGCVVVGHLRYFAAQQLELDEVPIVIARGLSPRKMGLYRQEDQRQIELCAGHWDSITEEIMAQAESSLALTETETAQESDFNEWEMPARTRFVTNRQSESKTAQIRFGDFSIPLQRAEMTRLVRALAEHEQRTGSQRGFVEWLVSREAPTSAASA